MVWICERCGTENEYTDAASAMPCICCGKRPGVTESIAAEKAYKAEAEEARKAKVEEQKAREEMLNRARREAERRAQDEAARRAREEAERRTREEIAHKEADRKRREEAERKAKEKAKKRYWMIHGAFTKLAWVGTVLLSLTLMTFLKEWIIDLEALPDGSEELAGLAAFAAWWLMIRFIDECIDIWPLIVPAIVGCIMIYGIAVNGFAWLKEDPRWVFTHLAEIIGFS